MVERIEMNLLAMSKKATLKHKIKKKEEKNMRRQFKVFMVVVTLCALLLASNAYALEEGGYVGNDPVAKPVVWNFIKHFVWNQYLWAKPYQFTYLNNYFVDNMDFAFYCGHGAPWYICTYFGNIDLSKAGSSSHKGYGNRDLEFITFHSCKVVPSPIEKTNWWSKWITEPTDIFDGLHQAIGFRTVAYKSSAPKISNKFGKCVRRNKNIIWSWFNAINKKGLRYNGKLMEKGSIVFYPFMSIFDRYYGPKCPDPPQNHQGLCIIYQR